MNDFRLALRSLAKTPGFAALAVVILGLGLGVNVTLFTLVRALLLAPPPGVMEPDRLIRLNGQNQSSVGSSLSYPDYQFYRDQNRTLTGLAAFASPNVVLANTGTDAVEARAALVSGNYFRVLGIPMAAGRVSWIRKTPLREPLRWRSSAIGSG